jgi:DNA-binding transcriptional LysR family regulator
VELRHLRSFVAVAEELHFARAAQRLFVSQPALSQQIRGLEAELGLRLLERDRRGVRLTPEGAAFLAEARAFVRQADQVATVVRALAEGAAGHLRLSDVLTVPSGLPERIVREHRRRYPAPAGDLAELADQARLADARLPADEHHAPAGPGRDRRRAGRSGRPTPRAARRTRCAPGPPQRGGCRRHTADTRWSVPSRDRRGRPVGASDHFPTRSELRQPLAWRLMVRRWFVNGSLRFVRGARFEANVFRPRATAADLAAEAPDGRRECRVS